MILCSLVLAALSACGGGGSASAGGDGAMASEDGSGGADLTLADAGLGADASAASVLSTKAASVVGVPVAAEGQTFRVPGTMAVRFGAGSTWVTRNVTDSGTCSAAFFGTSTGGLARSCEVMVSVSASNGAAALTVGLPAAEDATFYVLGTRLVQYGANGRFVSKPVSGRVNCSNGFFGDPAIGTVKTCQLAPPGATALSMMATVDASKIVAPATGFSTARVMAANVADPGQRPGPGDIGAFREYCEFSHMSYDDPIVAPGSRSGHLHTFLGNTGTNANSTAASIAGSGNSTCSGGTLNRTSYWVPTVIDTLDGTPQKPVGSLIYYKQNYDGVPAASIRAFPAGLRMIAGNAGSSGPQGMASFTCFKTDGTWTTSSAIPADCAAGSTLRVGLGFPQCWDGVNLDAPDHKSHMAYPRNGCPATHPVALTGITYEINYVVGAGGTSHWRLSSDNYDRSLPGGYSSHADWFNGWDVDIVNVWTTRCINATMDCHAYLIGDGRILY